MVVVIIHKNKPKKQIFVSIFLTFREKKGKVKTLDVYFSLHYKKLYFGQKSFHLFQ